MSAKEKVVIGTMGFALAMLLTAETQLGQTFNAIIYGALVALWAFGIRSPSPTGAKDNG